MPRLGGKFGKNLHKLVHNSGFAYAQSKEAAVITE